MEYVQKVIRTKFVGEGYANQVCYELQSLLRQIIVIFTTVIFSESFGNPIEVRVSIGTNDEEN